MEILVRSGMLFVRIGICSKEPPSLSSTLLDSGKLCGRDIFFVHLVFCPTGCCGYKEKVDFPLWFGSFKNCGIPFSWELVKVEKLSDGNFSHLLG